MKNRHIFFVICAALSSYNLSAQLLHILPQNIHPPTDVHGCRVGTPPVSPGILASLSPPQPCPTGRLGGVQGITAPEISLPIPGSLVPGANLGNLGHAQSTDLQLLKPSVMHNIDIQKLKLNNSLLGELKQLYGPDSEFIKGYLADEDAKHLTTDQQIAQRTKDIESIKEYRAQHEKTASNKH